MDKLRLGVAGLGRGFLSMLPTLAAHPGVALVAAADPRADGRAQFAHDFTARTYATVEEMCADPGVDVVYVATPHQYHRRHVEVAAAYGKHVLVEKPMALTLEDCRAMTDATTRAGVVMVIGHSHGFDLPYARTRELIAGGEYGRLRMITTLNFTDFMYRPRRPEELVSAQGGGVLFSQAAHQIDIVRLLGGGMLRSLRAHTGIWDPARQAEGAYQCLLEFEDGATASLTYSGYGHFDSDALGNWIGEMGMPKSADDHGAARRALLASTDDEAAMKNARGYGGPAYQPAAATAGALHQHFGLFVASCERADLCPGPDGVWVHGELRRHLIPLPPPEVPRTEVIDELRDAVLHGRRPLHDGPWGMATLEACLAIAASARDRKEVQLRHQVPTP